MTHTPTPWTIAPSSNPHNGTDWRDVRAHGEFGEMYLGEALEQDAAHIVRCVNSHDALVEALRYVRQFYQDNFDIMPVAFQTVDSEIERALALAEKGA